MKNIMEFIKRLFEDKYTQRQRSQHMASQIGFYYLSLQPDFSDDSYKKAREDITMLGITDVNFDGTKVTITLTRPGLLIGRRGENLNKLQSFLYTEYKKTIKISIVENVVLQYLLPYVPDMDCLEGF